MLTLATTQNWHIKQIYYVLVYTQAMAETDMYMDAPKGFIFKDLCGNASKEYVFQIKRTYYGQKRGAWVWNQHLVRKLQEAGFTQSSHEECFFYHGTAMYVLYMDDSIQADPNQNELGDIIAKMEQTGLNMTYDNGIEGFFGCPC